jgi:Fe-S-cluster-containing dehydrogenase component/formate-dependent nitrite reductase membrane component NrfD
MRYGFVIDNTRCIGCHACSTACKSENEVPLGVARTWVKTVEHGTYPDVQRSFQVTRCNHCENPPCVTICPTGAMFQRPDGIVEFDKDKCIGCKACMQACPYDAIHIDPATKTAAKCHFCAHRVEAGLEPACVVVCPTEAITAGDLDDPRSKISQLVSISRLTVRKPEQGTKPKLFYIDDDGGRSAALPHAEQSSSNLAWDPHLASPSGLLASPALARPSVEPRRMAEHLVGGRTTYNQQHRVPWHWQVPAYLVTKAIAAGIFLFLALGWNLGLFAFEPGAMLWGGLLGVVMTLATTGLLIADLDRPERFLFILMRPQWRSWLTRGAFLLIAFATVSGAWWLAEQAIDLSALGRTVLGWVTAPLAVGAAVYTAFLFGQAEGRALWRSRLLPVHLLIQATMMGSGAMLAIAGPVGLSIDLVDAAKTCFAIALGVDAFVVLFGERRHTREDAARAVREIRQGRHARKFWWGSIVLGHAVPLALLLIPHAHQVGPWLGALAALLATGGLYAYEHAFVMAPQEIPNS